MMLEKCSISHVGVGKTAARETSGIECGKTPEGPGSKYKYLYQ